MQIEESKVLIIGQAVIAGLTIQGKFGAAEYTAQELFDKDKVKLETINNLYGTVTQALAAVPKVSLYDRTTESATTKKLKAQQLLLETVFDIRTAMEKEEKASKLARNEAAAKLALLKNIKNKKEIETLEGLSQEELDKQIADATALVEA
jgi:hypothetical protein